MKPTSFVVTKVPQNFIYPEIKEQDFKFGSGELTGTPLRADGDWRGYLPPEEDQNIRGIESSACYVEASQHAIATIEEEQFGELDNNYSSRFNALCSDGTPSGGDPLKGADSMRHDGLVPDSLMPFGDYITTWGDFHSFKGAVENVVRTEGKKYLGKKILGYDVVCERNDPLAVKYLKLKQALQYSPCPVSVTAWYENDGVYYKPEGLRDNHLVELVYIDEFNHPYIRDTYAPYMKKLEANFNFDFAMRWSVEKASAPVVDNSILAWIKAFLAWFEAGQTVPMPPLPPILQTPPVTIPPMTVPPAQDKKALLQKMCTAIRTHEGWYPGSRSQRNRNPGNCKFSTVGYLPKYGNVKKDKDGFAIFPTLDLGWLYINNLILDKAQKHPTWSLSTFFKEYAPAIENDTTRYTTVVAQEMGVSPFDWQMKNLL